MAEERQVQDEKDTTASKLTKEQQEEIRKNDEVRTKLAMVWAQVRAAEYTKTVASFSYDHYIEEAKRRLNGDGRKIRDAEGNVIDNRPSDLERLSKLREDFNKVFADAKKLASTFTSDEQEVAS